MSAKQSNLSSDRDLGYNKQRSLTSPYIQHLFVSIQPTESFSLHCANELNNTFPLATTRLFASVSQIEVKCGWEKGFVTQILEVSGMGAF